MWVAWTLFGVTAVLLSRLSKSKNWTDPQRNGPLIALFCCVALGAGLYDALCFAAGYIVLGVVLLPYSLGSLIVVMLLVRRRRQYKRQP